MTNATQEQIDLGASQDELTLRQQDAIEKEICSKTCLVGERETLLGLLPEYSTDEIYKLKIYEINKNYEFMRRMRPDGNCFFRAFSFGCFERLIGKPEELTAFKEKLVAAKDILEVAGFTQFTVQDFYDNFVDMVDKVAGGMTEADLFNDFQNQSIADYLVVFLRILTSAELRKSSEFYSNFIEGDRTLEDFCQLEVEPMYKESDHIHIIALATALGVGVRVAYMDRGTSTIHDFPDAVPPAIHMLYRPGHYDIIYPKTE